MSFVMSSQGKSDQNNSPLTKADLIPLLEGMKSFVHSSLGDMKSFVHSSLEDMKSFVHSAIRASESVLREDLKDFVRATAKASETVLREEIQIVRNELRQEIQAVNKELGSKIDLVQCAITEHSKSIRTLETNVKEHDHRLTILEHGTA